LRQFIAGFFVGTETHPSYAEFIYESHHASRYDCMPANDYSGINSAIAEVLEVIAKRLESLENKRYFPSPEFEHFSKIYAQKVISTAIGTANNAVMSTVSSTSSSITTIQL